MAVLPGIAAADWREDLGALRIGIVTGANPAESIAKAEPFRLAVQEALALPVEFFPAPDISSLASAHADGRVEYAIMTATGYAAAWKSCECVEPLAVALMGDKTSSFRSLVIAPRSAGIGSAGELRGKRIMALSPDSVGGKAWPLFLIGKEGIRLEDRNVATVINANGSEDAVRRFLAGEADALIGWSSFTGDPATGYTRGTLRQINTATGGGLNAYRVVWQSPAFPHRTHSVRKNLSAEAKQILARLLINLYENDPVAYDAIEPVFGGGFAVASQSMYAPLVDFVSDPMRTGKPVAGEEALPGDAGPDQTETLQAPDMEIRTGTPSAVSPQ